MRPISKQWGQVFFMDAFFSKWGEPTGRQGAQAHSKIDRNYMTRAARSRFAGDTERGAWLRRPWHVCVKRASSRSGTKTRIGAQILCKISTRSQTDTPVYTGRHSGQTAVRRHEGHRSRQGADTLTPSHHADRRSRQPAHLPLQPRQPHTPLSATINLYCTV